MRGSGASGRAEAQEAPAGAGLAAPPTQPPAAELARLVRHLAPNGKSGACGRIESEPALVAPPRWGLGLEDSDRRRPLVVLDLEDLRGQLRKPVDVVELISWALRHLVDGHADTLPVAPE